ncbi:MAG TPA: allantoinase AllB [Pseudonocardiaceae bacterium]|nr:allantoinase AllB [Pseudonocardiaceae bacterium]
MRYDLAIRARRIVTPTGERHGVVGIRDGRIAVLADTALNAADQVDLADDEVLLPGSVDSHVHVNEPGRTEWEGFATATRAAAAGGVTTIIDMPLNSVPPTIDTAALAVKRAATAGKLHVDVGFWGGAVPGNTADLAALHDAGVFGFKAFTLHSGVDEFGHLNHDELADALCCLADLDAMLIVHAEDAATIAAAPPPTGQRYADFLASRPRAAENIAIADLLALAQRFGTRLHILHLSSSDALPMLRDAKRAGIRVTAETCPHYLTFTAEEIPDGATQFKCCPPIREAANRENLWQGLADGTIDLVVTDHSPCTAALKRLDVGDFGLAWGGIAGLQVGLSAVWTQARQRGISLTQVARWMAEHPADLVGLPTKGRIAVGADADLCAFAPDAEFTVAATNLHHRNPISAYHGTRLTGTVRATWLRGVRVTAAPTGILLRRGEA